MESGEPINYLDASVLGLVEGVTEYLPISSTGHLILANEVLGLNKEIELPDAEGNIIYTEEPSEDLPDGEKLTLKGAADAYAIIIQAGAIAAVLLLYWKRVWSVALGFLGRDREGLLLGRNLVLAFVPAVVLGLLFDDFIESYLFGPWPVVAALIAGGILMLAVEWWRKRRGVEEKGRRLHQLTIRQSLMIGLFQCVAMWPGTSRSMMTIVGGYVAGLRPARAAEFSFLLGLITLTAAAGYRGIQVGPALLDAVDWKPILLGCIVAFVSAAVAVKWMVGYLTRHGLALFAYYRFILAGVVIAYLVWGMNGQA